jgi:hypothetical protein
MNKMKNIIRKNDEYDTPLYAVKLIEPYLKPNSLIWCPFDKEYSNFVKYFESVGHKVVYSHIDYGQDFLKAKIKTKFDYIVSNPPYSIKDKIYQKLFELDIPFAMLVNLQGLADGKIRFDLFQSNEVEIMYVYPRICYIRDGKQTKGNIFQSGYICHNVLPQKVMFINGY